MTENAKASPKAPWFTVITAAVVGSVSLIIGVLNVQIAQGNPWWALGAPVLLLALASLIWFLTKNAKEKDASP